MVIVRLDRLDRLRRHVQTARGVRLLKNGYRGVRNALRDLPLSDDDAAVYREAIARLNTAKARYMAFYKEEDTSGMGDGVFGDVAEQLQGRLDALPGQS